MNLVVNLRPDANATPTLTVPALDVNGNPIVNNGVPQTYQIVNPAYIPNRGNAHIVVYTKNHNVLRVVNGFAGLLFKI
jgi:hypothetical protein